MSDESNFIGYLANGIAVYDREDSHWKTAHKNVSEELLKEALSKITISDDEKEQKLIIRKVDMGRPIGINTCLSVDDSDQTFMAKRKGRVCLSHIVINRKKEECNKIVVLLWKTEEGYSLTTTYIGTVAPREPGDPSLLKSNDPALMEEAKEFWDSHAIVYDRDTIEYVISPDGKQMTVDEFESTYMSKPSLDDFDIPEDALTMLIGVAASGKSSVSKSISNRYNSEIISSDSLRDVMFEKELENGEKEKVYQPESKEKVYSEMISRIEANLQNGKGTIADATFLFDTGEKARKQLYELVKKYNRPLRVIILQTPLDLAKNLNQKRERKVGNDVIEQMWYHMEKTYDDIIKELSIVPNAQYIVLETKDLISDKANDEIRE